MKKLTIIFFYFLISLNFLFFLSPATARIETKSAIAIADSTIIQNLPTTNYGDYYELDIGWYSGDPNTWMETFIKFDLSDKPNDLYKAELKLEFQHVSGPANIELYETSSNWYENSITWNNAPLYGLYILSQLITNEEIYTFDVSTPVEYNNGYWSICLTTFFTESEFHWLYIASRENGDLFYTPPTIIFYYEVSDLPIILTIVGIVVAVGVSGGLGYFYYKKRKKLRDVPREIPPQILKKQPQNVSENIKFCINCGSQNPNKAMFCLICGNKFP